MRWYAAVDENAKRTVARVAEGTQAHLMSPLPLAWGYFATRRQACYEPLVPHDERWTKFVSRASMDAIDRAQEAGRF